MAGVDFNDITQVEVYVRNQTASTPDKEQALVTRLGISAEHCVIDLGAGTGNFALSAAKTGASVHAVDISELPQCSKLMVFSTCEMLFSHFPQKTMKPRSMIGLEKLLNLKVKHGL